MAEISLVYEGLSIELTPKGDKGDKGDAGELLVLEGRVTDNAAAIVANDADITANSSAIAANTRDILTSDADITANSSAIEANAAAIEAIPASASNTPDILMGFTAALTGMNGILVFNAALAQTQSVESETADTIELNLMVPSEGLVATHLTIVSTRLINIDKVEAVEFGRLFADDDDFVTPTLVVVEGVSYYVYQSVAEEVTSGLSTWKITYDLSSGGLSDEDEARIEANTVLASGNVLHHTVVINDPFTLGGEWSHPKFDNVSVFTFTFLDAQTAQQAAELLPMSAIAPLNSSKTAARLVVKIQRLEGNRIKVFLEGQMSAAASSSGNSNIQFWQTTRQGKVTRIVGGLYLEDVQSLEVAGPADIATLVTADTAIKLLVTANTDAIAAIPDIYDETVLSERVTANADAIAAIPDVATAISGKAEISNTYTHAQADDLLDAKLNSDLTGFDGDTTDTQKAAFIEFLELTDAAGFSEEALRLLITANTDALAVTYTQTQINAQNTVIRNSVNTKANTADVYTQTYITANYTTNLDLATAFDLKANTADVYTRIVIDDKLDDKLDTTNGAVGTDNLANGSITSRKIQNGTISHDDLASDSIFADNIANGQVQTHHLALGAVTNDHILDRTIAGSKLAAGVIPDPVDITGKLDKDWANITDLELSHLGSRTRPLWGLLSSRETTAEFFLKANVSETYTRTEIDTLISGVTGSSYDDTALSTRVTTNADAIAAIPAPYDDTALSTRVTTNTTGRTDNTRDIVTLFANKAENVAVTALLATKLEDDLSNLSDDLTDSEKETARVKIAAGEVITTAMVSPTANEIVLSKPLSSFAARVRNNRYNISAPADFTEADVVEYNNLVGNYIVLSDRNDPHVLPDSPPLLIISVVDRSGDVPISVDTNTMSIFFDPIIGDEFVAYIFGRFLEGVGTGINRINGGDLNEDARTLTVPSARDITMLADMIASNATRLTAAEVFATESRTRLSRNATDILNIPRPLAYNNAIYTSAQGDTTNRLSALLNTVYSYQFSGAANINEFVSLPRADAIGDTIEFVILGVPSSTQDLTVNVTASSTDKINGVASRAIPLSSNNWGTYRFTWTGETTVIGWAAVILSGRA